jgi:hypothetical protein
MTEGPSVGTDRVFGRDNEWTKRLFIPMRRETFRKELYLYAEWYNEHRPHQTLDGRTPNEVYFDRPAANEAPRFEPRPCWPQRGLLVPLRKRRRWVTLAQSCSSSSVTTAAASICQSSNSNAWPKA